eukprot:TRINITY_DN104585_c0_g1_i1.p1 TRINITY_DN104585_c0_g1~~TRINITY_DN104585_c0_g1_i1.p1  ORF type:complete len:1011 (-),score=231.74 TRINITY_DN104585_c0_g1_i1:65-3046(-)
MALWHVLADLERGGLVVRQGPELGSAVDDLRLACGAVVEELEFCGGRLHYKLVTGSGPSTGWVTTTLRGKDLIVKTDEHCVAQRCEEKASTQPAACAGEGVSIDRLQGDSASAADSEQLLGEKRITDEENEAFCKYEEKFGQTRDGSEGGFNRISFSWYTPKLSNEAPNVGLQVAAQAAALAAKKKVTPALRMQDAEGDDVTLCARCFLPLGDVAYEGRQKATFVHAECMAHVLCQEAQEVEDQRLQEQRETKLQSRLEHCIGWASEKIPQNGSIAERLGCNLAPQALCCLVLDEAARTVRIAATHEPAASVNLEYLLLALRVRRHESREPLFSLDPVDAQNIEKSPQKKRFEPEWLSGTSVGDVMFQADYFLKELAMGEYTMPVVGMPSVFDLSEIQNSDKTWAGREWFVVKKAEVRMAEDKTLIPFVKMGVEAREQVMGKTGMEDAPITGANHPLKRFADAFTRCYDLIAERKSVVFHLRELAKASVMAKYLVDSKTKIDQSWYDVADQLISTTTPDPHPEIPQLWNMRGNQRIQLKDGKLIDSETGMQSNVHAIYGGVQFGLDRFELAQRSSLPGFQMQQSGLSPVESMQMQSMQLGPSGRPMFMPQRFQLSQRGEMPQGVDLNLDQFSLSSADKFAGQLPACGISLDSAEAQVTLGRVFLEKLKQRSYTILDNDKRDLLCGVFNPSMCDRTSDADAFIPPDPSLQYIQKIRSLVQEEKSWLERRKATFCSKSFVVGNAGAEFPRSWTSRFQIADSQERAAAMNSALVKLPVDDSFQDFFVSEILPSAAPEFNKATEDGVLFRIYKFGNIEVRTVTEVGEPEKVVAAFSVRLPAFDFKVGLKCPETFENEALIKVSIYTEAIETRDSKPLERIRYYVVLETDAGNFVVTEKQADGSISWLVNSKNLQVRNSLAKLVLAREIQDKQLTVSKVRGLTVSHSLRKPATFVDQKRYMRAVVQMVEGKTQGKAYPHQGPRRDFSRLARMGLMQAK